ncbi:MAG TPA: transporter, partial [Rhodospirillales bacterium]|nr:transporter [Rhodospirillales bacterium]
YAAAPPGTSLILGYGQFAWKNSFYTRSGNEISDSELQTQTGILRVVHYVDVFGITCDPQFFIPFAGVNNAKLGGEHLSSTFGLGDIIVASTCWVVNQPEKKRWVGITPFIFFPTGSYRDQQPLNVGENRYKGVLQVGYVESFDKWTVDLIADTTFYGDNDDAGDSGNQKLKQDNSYQLQAWLRRALRDDLSLGVGWSGTWGGNVQVGGENTVLSTEAQQLRLITQYFVLPDLQLQAQVRTDVWSEGGYRETVGLNLRVMKVF